MKILKKIQNFAAEQNRAGVAWTEDLVLDRTPAIDNAINSLFFWKDVGPLPASFAVTNTGILIQTMINFLTLTKCFLCLNLEA